MKRTLLLGTAAIVALAALAARAGAQTLGTTTSDISGARSRTQETSAGNLVADALRATARTDAAIVAADALTGETVGKGSLSRDALKTLLTDPEDEVATLSLTGAQLRVVLQRSISAYPKPFDGFLQVSGLTMTFSAGRSAAQRAPEVKVNGVPLDPNKRYTVATLSTLAGGGLGYFRMWDQRSVTNGNKSVLTALADYVQSEREIAPRVEGRITAR